MTLQNSAAITSHSDLGECGRTSSSSFYRACGSAGHGGARAKTSPLLVLQLLLLLILGMVLIWPSAGDGALGAKNEEPWELPQSLLS